MKERKYIAKKDLQKHINNLEKVKTALNKLDKKNGYCTCLSRIAVPMGTYFKCKYCGLEIEN